MFFNHLLLNLFLSYFGEFIICCYNIWKWYLLTHFRHILTYLHFYVCLVQLWLNNDIDCILNFSCNIFSLSRLCICLFFSLILDIKLNLRHNTHIFRIRKHDFPIFISSMKKCINFFDEIYQPCNSNLICYKKLK